MRLATERRAAGSDDYGGPDGAWSANLTDTSCWAWQPNARLTDNGQREVTVAPVLVMVALGTDITDDDRITSIVDRNSGSVYGKLYVDAVQRRKNHLLIHTRDHQ